MHIQFSSQASQNSLGQGKTYQDPLLRIFRLLLFRFKLIDPETLLRYSVQAPNDTSGRNRLVHFLLVFGVSLVLSLPNKNLPHQKGIFEALRYTHKGVAVIYAQGLPTQANSRNFLSAARNKIKKGDSVTVFTIHGKHVFVSDVIRVNSSDSALVLRHEISNIKFARIQIDKL